MENILKELFESFYGEAAVSLVRLPGHASARVRFLMRGSNNICLGVVHSDVKENRAFISFARTFRDLGLNVPEVYLVASDETVYLEEYLGELTLYDCLLQSRTCSDQTGIEDSVLSLYKYALKNLVIFQVKGAEKIDFGLCHPRKSYDAESMMFDLEQFRLWFLDVNKVSYNATLLFSEFKELADSLAQAPSEYFMYRDFQARNIIVNNRALGFVDFQSGRKGPLQYDVVSLLYQVQAGLSSDIRELLLDHYLLELNRLISINSNTFRELFDGFVLIRLYQVLATYGREGLIGKKEYFLKGIPKALGALSQALGRVNVLANMKELTRVSKLISKGC